MVDIITVERPQAQDHAMHANVSGYAIRSFLSSHRINVIVPAVRLCFPRTITHQMRAVGIYKRERMLTFRILTTERDTDYATHRPNLST